MCVYAYVHSRMHTCMRMHMRRSSRRIEFPSEPRTDVGNATPSIDLPAPSPLVELVAAASGARNADADDAVTLAVRPARDACATTGTTSTASNDASHMTSSSCNGAAIASPRTTTQTPAQSSPESSALIESAAHSSPKAVLFIFLEKCCMSMRPVFFIDL